MLRPETLLRDGAVLLRPLEVEDIAGLWAVAQEPEIWQYMRAGLVDSEEKMRAWVRSALEARAKGGDFPFVTVEMPSGTIAGATRYMTIDAANRSLEIGGTWIGAPFRRSKVNTHAKYLMLRHAFEDLGCLRVQLRTDSRNERSQRAIERIGAKREVVFRKDFIYPDGYQRDTVFYSVIEPEWPAVKARLEEML
jgi:RimJ/RimL family protein N-acetyltransferase